LKNYFKYLLYIYVFIGLNIAKAGSYDDFFKAIDLDQPEVVMGLMARGFDPNSPNANGVPALLLCYQKKSMKVLDVMLSAKQTNLNMVNSSGENLLMLAAIDNQLALVQKLIDKGADVNKPGWTALHYAASKGHIDMIRLLLDQQAYIDAESPNGTTPLMMAARYSTPKTVKLLLEEGADPRIRNQLGYDALQMAQKQASSAESASYVQAFLTAWNEKYNSQPAPIASQDDEDTKPPSIQTSNDGTDMPTAQPTAEVAPEPPATNASVSIEPLQSPPMETSNSEELNANAPAAVTDTAVTAPENEEPLLEAQTGAPLVNSNIESTPINTDGTPQAEEVRSADTGEENPATANAVQIEIAPVDVPAENTVPYSKQVRSKSVVTVDLTGNVPAEETSDQ
jgi:hypothetical protein